MAVATLKYVSSLINKNEKKQQKKNNDYTTLENNNKNIYVVKKNNFGLLIFIAEYFVPQYTVQLLRKLKKMTEIYFVIFKN